MPWCHYCPRKPDGTRPDFANDGELFNHYVREHDGNLEEQHG